MYRLVVPYVPNIEHQFDTLWLYVLKTPGMMALFE